MNYSSSSTLEPLTQSWAIDPSHTQVGFAVKHLMISTVKGRFTNVSGTVEVDLTSSQVDVSVSIDATTVTTADEKRDAHLRSGDFLQAEVHPTLEFRGSRIDGNIEKKFTLVGDLTIRGVTRPVAVYVVNQGRVTDPWGNERVGYAATATMSRKDFGLEWNMALEAGGVLVGDEVRITIETELVRQ